MLNDWRARFLPNPFFRQIVRSPNRQVVEATNSGWQLANGERRLANGNFVAVQDHCSQNRSPLAIHSLRFRQPFLNRSLDFLNGRHPLGFIAGENFLTVDEHIKLALVNRHEHNLHVPVEPHAVIAQKLVCQLDGVRLVSARLAVCDANAEFRHSCAPPCFGFCFRRGWELNPVGTPFVRHRVCNPRVAPAPSPPQQEKFLRQPFHRSNRFRQ
jgi:hypothetical protein